MKNSIDFYIDDINISGTVFRVERVRNLDDLVDKVSDELFAEDERLPYWAELWPSALALSEYIVHKAPHFSDKKILELGCGLGLTSLALEYCKPALLLATDYEEAALEQTRKNFLLNKFKIPELSLLDWREPKIMGTYDLIVASDIAYEQRFFEPLTQLFKKYLKKDGLIILAEPNRVVARSFFGKLILNGFKYSFDERFVEQLGKKIRVNIYSIGYKNVE